MNLAHFPLKPLDLTVFVYCVTTLRHQMTYFHVYRCNLRCKSTSQSYRTPIYYVDLTLREG
jgi:hypothetical protein